MDNLPGGEILIVGLGSVGRRHLTNLASIWDRIRLCRTGRSTLPDADLADFPVDYDLEEALARRPLAVIVSNPSALHLPVARAAAEAGAHLLIEKPLSHTLDGVDALDAVVTRRRLVALVGFQFRFNPGLQQVKGWIEGGAIGEVVNAQVHWGEYLPGMHPWEDYRISYAARADLGGGALLTFSHAFDYLRWLVGDIVDVAATGTRPAFLGVDVDTCVDVTLRFARGAVGHVHLDFVQQPHTHHLTIIGTEGTITWNHVDHAARRYSASSKQWETVTPPDGFERNWMFLDEMRHFVDCIRGEASALCTLADGREALRVVEAARHSLEAVMA